MITICFHYRKNKSGYNKCSLLFEKILIVEDDESIHNVIEELAEKINVSRQTIFNWENGRFYPDIDALVK